ncbi:MAG: pilus assembly protein [Gammaproteobacteria bacterium]|nr:pilus assembly protein [Gammaproteobacteria bacterium]MYF27272.1 pilus assembly protein [Gammaproteobacteria bacterium]MYK46427.1 pilus assembly protein [Gammaproteobacteria bacterium]
MHQERRTRPGGIIAVEFALILLVVLPLAVAVGEFYRVSLYDQVLARATHLAALAGARDPDNCETAVRDAFAGHGLAAWLFDGDGDGTIGFVTGTDPDGSSASEVRIDIASDVDLSDGVDFTGSLCGPPESWIRIVSRVEVRVRFGLGRVVLEQVGWAVNQA